MKIDILLLLVNIVLVFVGIAGVVVYSNHIFVALVIALVAAWNAFAIYAFIKKHFPSL